ncbi:MAG TPA: glycosyl hydrolase family 65 protein, partial [Chryseolinea sp.]|nr:glycosyl hydrolase family 65 protein [Chryseolinea sp.]
VYGVHPHTGRGGWTWYTGSAGWMYQLILSSFLGIKREADKLSFEPCIPAAWEGFNVKYRYLSSWYHIALHQQMVEDDSGISVVVDDATQPDGVIKLQDDDRIHVVTIRWSPPRGKRLVAASTLRVNSEK